MTAVNISTSFLQVGDSTTGAVPLSDERIVCYGKNQLCVRGVEASSRTETPCSVANEEWITRCVVSPDERFIYSGGTTLTKHDLATGRLIASRELGADDEVAALSLSPCGGTIAVGFQHGDVHLFSTSSDSLKKLCMPFAAEKTKSSKKHPLFVMGLAATNSFVIAAGIGTSLQWLDPKTLALLRTVPSVLSNRPADSCLAVSPDERLAAVSAREEHVVTVFDTSSGEKVQELPCANARKLLFVTQQLLAVVSMSKPGADTKLEIWCVPLGAMVALEIIRGDSSNMQRSAAMCGGRIVVGAFDNKIRFFDLTFS